MSEIMMALLWAVAAALLLVPPPAGRRLLEMRRGRAARASWASRWFWLAILAVIGELAVLSLFGWRAGAWTLVGLLLASTCGRLGFLAHERRRQERRRAQVSAAAQVVSGQLRAGALPRRALVLAAQECPGAAPAAATIAIGGDAGRALMRAGELAGQQGLASLGRVWSLAEGTGAPMADLAERVREQVCEEAETRALVAAELAAPRASSRLLALLPVLGMMMGSAAGGDPIGFLTGTGLGLVCLVCGTALACAGVLWSDQMARAAEEWS